MKSKRKRQEEQTVQIEDLFDNEYEFSTDLPSTFLETMETDTKADEDDPEMKEKIKRLRTSKAFDALYRLKRHDANARKFFAKKYGADSLKYIMYLNKYMNDYIGRKRLEEEYLRQSWNLMKRVGKNKATEFLDEMEKFMEKIRFKDNS